jgi:hypothetical protein
LGVLDRLIEEGLEVHAVCGVLSGALIGVTLAQGLVRDGNDGTHGGPRAATRALWQRFARAHAMSPLQSARIERLLWGWDLSNSVVWRGLEGHHAAVQRWPGGGGDAGPARGTAKIRGRHAIAPAGHSRRNPDRDPVIPLTSRPAVRGYHWLTSHTPEAHRAAARNSVRPCA